MMRVLLFILIVFMSSLTMPYVNGQPRSDREVKPYKVVKTEDYSIGYPVDGKYERLNRGYVFVSVSDNKFDGLFTNEFSSSDFYGSVQFTPIGGTSIFDQQSNACVVQIWQDPDNPQFIHTVYMESPFEDTHPVFPSRRTRYYFSSNYGNTWEFRAELPVNTRSGYGTITGISDGSVLIANHFISGPNVNRTFIHQEVFPQLGSFNRLDPGLGQTGQVEWPRIVASNNILDPVKFSLLSSSNIQGNVDSAFHNYCTSMINSGQFGQWKSFRSRKDECYSIARSESGKIGVAFINDETRFPVDEGDVFFMESTNMGQTYSAPIKIFDADLTPSGDSLGAFRGISLIYSNDQPRVVFETVYQDINLGFFPGIASNIRYWTPSLPGSNPNKSIVAVDSLDLPFYPHQGVNDLLTGICRPVIGKSDDGSALFVAFMAADSIYGGNHTPTTFHDIYLTASVNNGFEWKAPVKLNSSSPRKDWTYVSISPTNDQNTSNYFVNLTMQADNIPGSYPAGPANGKSLAQQIFSRVTIGKPLLVNPVSGEIPDKFFLYQNYPNPFNPETTIKFSITENSDASLKIYDINGKKVKTIFEKRNLSPGVYTISLKLGELSSGVYFYSFETPSFSKTRKLLLLK